MRRLNKLIILFLLTVMLFGNSCSAPPQGPLDPDGEAPAMLAAFPDTSYLMLLFCDAQPMLRSALGERLLNRFIDEEQLASINNSSVLEMVSEVAVGVTFNSRAYPDLARAFDWQAVLRLTVDMEVIKGFIALNVVEISTYMERDVYAVNALFGTELAQPVYFTISEDLLISASSREAMERIVKTLTGSTSNALVGGKAPADIASASKSHHIWLISRQDSVARNLLQQLGLAPYTFMTGAADFEEGLTGALEMAFEKTNHARQTALSLDFMLNAMQRFPATEQNAALIEKVSQTLKRSIEADHDGTLAWFEINLSGGDIESLIDFMTTSPDAPPLAENEDDEQ